MTIDGRDGRDHYVFYAPSMRYARREAKDFVERGMCDATLVEVRRVKETGARRPLALVGLAFVTCGVTIAAAVVVGLSVGGVL